MKTYDHIAPLLAQPNESFDAFYADMQTKLPALSEAGPIELPQAGFRTALKAAYIAGGADTMEQLLTPDSTNE